MKNFLSKIVVWCNTHIWQSVLIGVATVGVVATAIAVPIALSDKSHEHTFGEWQIVTPATCTVDGVEERSCSCGETETKKIDATGHTYSTEWTTDDTYHWHVATCCETEEVSNKSEHEWGEWSVKTPATCTQDGLRERECSICHDKESEKINSTGHTYSQDWTSDDTHHWHEATCEHTDEVCEKEEHDFLPFGLCKCGKYIGTDIPLESKVYDLPDLAYGESVYYRMKNFVGSVYLMVDHALVNSFIYLADSVSPIASPEPGETNPTFTYLWDDEGDDAIYIVVTNYNGTTVQGAHLEVEWDNSVG